MTDVVACEIRKIHKEIILVLYIVIQAFNFCLLTRPIFYSCIYLTILSVSQAECTTPSPTRFCVAHLWLYAVEGN
jgi:hypothetical protein